nr:gp06-like protein [Oryctes rhinoceros nudivirus]
MDPQQQVQQYPQMPQLGQVQAPQYATPPSYQPQPQSDQQYTQTGMQVMGAVPTPQYTTTYQQPQQTQYPQQQAPIQAQPPTVQTQSQTQYPKYLSSLANASNSGSGSSKTVIEDMEQPKISMDEAFDANRKAELMRDYETFKSMTLLDDEEVLYNLYLNSPAFTTSKFKVSILCAYYKDKYSDLVAKYDSVSVYLEFVLSKIIYSSEASLKDACASRTIRLPKSGGTSDFLRMFGCKKRGAVRMDAESPATKRTKQVTHPFLKTDEYKMQPILYNIGKCSDYAIPSEFAELFAHAQYESVTRITSGNKKEIMMGLKVTFTKPIVCILVSKSVASFTFISLEHLSTFGNILSNMTSLGKLEDTFAFGAKQSMQIETVNTGRIETKTDQKFDHGFFVAIINTMQVCKLSNKTLSSKTYANVVFSLTENTLSDAELNNCQLYIKTFEAEANAKLEEYDRELEDATNDTKSDSSS